MYHKRCGSPVAVDVSECFSLLALVTTSTSPNQLTTARIELRQVSSSLDSVSFCCYDCSQTVELDDVYSTCRICGDQLEIDQTLVPRDSNGTYCQGCVNGVYLEEQVITLEELLQATSLRIA